MFRLQVVLAQQVVEHEYHRHVGRPELRDAVDRNSSRQGSVSLEVFEALADKREVDIEQDETCLRPAAHDDLAGVVEFGPQNLEANFSQRGKCFFLAPRIDEQIEILLQCCQLLCGPHEAECDPVCRKSLKHPGVFTMHMAAPRFHCAALRFSAGPVHCLAFLLHHPNDPQPICTLIARPFRVPKR